jgi:hypothetical protein
MEAATRRSAGSRNVRREVTIKTDTLTIASALFTKNDSHRRSITVETKSPIDDETWRTTFKFHVHSVIRTYSTDKTTSREHFTGWCISGIAESHMHEKCDGQLFVDLNDNNVLVGKIVIKKIE